MPHARWLSLSATALALGLSAQAHAAAPIAVSLSLDSAAAKGSEDVYVTVTLKNVSSQPAKLLRWLAPVGELEEGIFHITRDGKDVPYQGAHYKRVAPTAKDYITIKPGQSLTRRVELSNAYDLTVSGQYAISYDVAAVNLFGDLDKNQAALKAGQYQAMQALDSQAANLWVNGLSYSESLIQKANETNAVTPAAFGISFTGRCSSTRQALLRDAVTAAQNMSNNALSYLNAGTAGPRYTTWFGTYTSARYATAKSHFTNIYSAMSTQSLTLDCSCKKSGTYAYVYPTQPYKIYLCGAFWNAPMTGTDSKGGTLVHEMSHFNVVAGTDDHAYGQSSAKSLAISSPDQALDNADNHEYFAENTPAQN
ncbi:MAG: peptidase M35 [Gammaproteobacteria bacterium]|nr:peptidase M35 [Gammaproteobacteria bacterium]